MAELYWITRLDALNLLVGIIVFIGIVGVLALCVGYLVTNGDLRSHENYLKWTRRMIWSGLIALIVNIFIPSQKEMFLIYGIGGTIDYIKQNDTAKQIPDKCIQALDHWVNGLLEEEKEDNPKNNEEK